ncbi:hypothetical protein PTKIN_Ptkin13bG0186100 [Pterospermum kingtungense]
MIIEAAQTGNINLLYELIQEDPYLFERIDQVPFLDTPLHIAAFAGHVDFVMEMINSKPSFAKKLNQAGLRTMHLALQNEQIQVVIRLLRVDKGLVRVRGREGLTPLHHAVQMGNIDLMIKFLEVCPEAIEDATVRDETPLHLAVKNDRFETFQVLVGWIKRSRHKAAQSWEKELLSWVDIEGNSALHVASIRDIPQVVEVLLENLCQDHNNAKNFKGLTALDIQLQRPMDERHGEIIKMLSKAGGLSGRTMVPNASSSSIHNIKLFKLKMSYFQKFATTVARGKKGISNEMRNAFLVVTVLIITTSYDASLNPPNNDKKTDQGHYSNIIDVSSMFWLYNTLTFWAAIGWTVYLLPSRTISLFLLITLALFGACYMLLVAVALWNLNSAFSKGSNIIYRSVSITNYCLSTLIAIPMAYRIAKYVSSRAGLARFLHILVVRVDVQPQWPGPILPLRFPIVCLDVQSQLVDVLFQGSKLQVTTRHQSQIPIVLEGSVQSPTLIKENS